MLQKHCRSNTHLGTGREHTLSHKPARSLKHHGSKHYWSTPTLSHCHSSSRTGSHSLLRKGLSIPIFSWTYGGSQHSTGWTWDRSGNLLMVHHMQARHAPPTIVETKHYYKQMARYFIKQESTSWLTCYKILVYRRGLSMKWSQTFLAWFTWKNPTSMYRSSHWRQLQILITSPIDIMTQAVSSTLSFWIIFWYERCIFVVLFHNNPLKHSLLYGQNKEKLLSFCDHKSLHTDTQG